MKKLNIGIFIDIFYPMIDGVVKVADNYARRLSKVANVTVFTCKNFVKGEYTDDFPYKVVRCKSIPIGYASYVLATPNQDSAFKKQLRESNLDIVHIHSPFTMGNAGLAYAKRHKIPCISTFHSQYRKDIDSITHNDLLTNIALAFIMPIFNQCTVCYTMNNFCKNILQSYGCKNKIEIVRNASDLIVLKTKEEYIQLANEKHSLQENDFVMLYVGRLYALKNIFLILEACKLLHESGITFKFYYVGTGIEESKLKKLITKYNLTTCVFLLGSITNQEELLSLYARANIFVFPSNYDTDGIVKIEAASVNTPTICLKNSAAASFIVDNYNGFLVENSASNLCAKIIELRQNASLLQRVGNNAKRDLFITWDSIVNDIYNKYLKLIEENNLNIALKADIKLKKKLALKEKREKNIEKIKNMKSAKLKTKETKTKELKTLKSKPLKSRTLKSRTLKSKLKKDE